MANGKRRRGQLSEEDRALWDAVKKTIKPLRDERVVERTARALEDEISAPKAPVDGAAKRTAKTAAALKPGRNPPPKKPAPPAKTYHPPAPPTLDRRTKQRIARGNIPIDGRLDLHGMTQREAHTRLRAFLSMAQMEGRRHVLVITGKGGSGAAWGSADRYGHDFAERGVLRRVVPHWLSMPEFRHYVSSFEEAHIAHGGAGAFYVRIKKSKR